MASEPTRLTHADVERIVQLVEDAGFGYVHFEADGLELTLEKEGYVEVATSAGEPPAASAPQAQESSGAGPAPVVADVAEEAAPATLVPSPEASADAPGVVRSPMVGIFYRSPDPESPPYVEVGQSVEVGDTIGLIEVMKMYTAVRAEVAGRVVEILAENAAQVESGQPLVRIEGA